MALLPDSSKIYLILKQVKPPSVPETGFNFLKDVSPVIPDILWVLFAFVLLLVFRKPLRELIPNIDGLEFKGIKLSFLLKESFNDIIKMAEKHKNWQVRVPEKDKERALKRAIKDRKLLEGARILWVDDFPENNNNERRMFRQLGVSCDFAQSTTSAIALLDDYDYDCIISDMERGEEKTAGIDLIRSMKDAQIRGMVIFYIGVYNEEKGTPVGGFGITNRPDQLLHLVLDALARVKNS